MGVIRHENTVSGSPIRAVVSFVGEDTGQIGPHLMVQFRNDTMLDISLPQIAEFLNQEVGGKGRARTISEDVERCIAYDFADVIKHEGGSYVYTGSKSTNVDRTFFSASYEDARQKSNEQDEILAETNAKGQIHAAGHFPADEAQGVYQHEIAVTESTSQKPVLGSMGAGPCIIVAVYNPLTKQALLTHIDVFTDLSSLSPHLHRLSAEGDTKLQAHLAGGDDSSKDNVTEVVKLLKEHGNIDIISADICRSTPLKNLAIDTRTGEVYTSFHLSQLDMGQDLHARGAKALISASPLNMIFDGIGLKRDVLNPPKEFGALGPSFGSAVKPQAHVSPRVFTRAPEKKL